MPKDIKVKISCEVANFVDAFLEFTDKQELTDQEFEGARRFLQFVLENKEYLTVTTS